MPSKSAFSPLLCALSLSALFAPSCGGNSSTVDDDAASGGKSSGGGSAGADGSESGGAATSGGNSASGGNPASGGTSTGGTTSSGGEDSEGGASSGGLGGEGGEPAVYGYCSKPCGTVVDCCPAGAIDCPSNIYPNNHHCIESACRPAECGSTADCQGENPSTDCVTLGGVNSCAEACDDDEDCPGLPTCSGVDDNGKKFCLAGGGSGCANDAACGGFGKCVDKVCVCSSASDCTHAGFTACAL